MWTHEQKSAGFDGKIKQTISASASASRVLGMYARAKLMCIARLIGHQARPDADFHHGTNSSPIRRRPGAFPGRASFRVFVSCSPGAMRTLNEESISFRAGEFRDTEIAEAQIRRRIVPLDADVARFELAAGAGVVALGAVVVPVGDLHAVDPGRQVVAVRDNRHAEPFAVLGPLLSGRLPSIDFAGAVILGG